MNTMTTRHLSELQKHRAIAAGEYLGEAILAFSRWLSRVAHAMHGPRAGA